MELDVAGSLPVADGQRAPSHRRAEEELPLPTIGKRRRTNKNKWVKKNREKKAAGIVEERKAGSVALGGWGGSVDRNRLAAG